MIALVTGGTGVVGKALCRELSARGVCVRVLTLPGDKQVELLPKSVKVFYGDVCDKKTFGSAFEGVDIVYHLAAILLSTDASLFEKINANGTKNVTLAAEKANVKRLVYVSSISVTYPTLTEYGKSKLKGECFVKNSKVPWTIIRPTLVIGDYGGVEFKIFANYVKRFPIYFLPGGGKSLKRPVQSVDLVKGIAVAGLSQKSEYKTYALAGSKIMSMSQIACAILAQNKKHHKMVPLPWCLAKKLAALKNFIGGTNVSANQALAGFLYDAAPDISDAERDLEYFPGCPFEKF